MSLCFERGSTSYSCFAVKVNWKMDGVQNETEIQTYVENVRDEDGDTVSADGTHRSLANLITLFH